MALEITRVSIHTRHYWRVKHDRPQLQFVDVAVSIHTRHYWRVKPGCTGTKTMPGKCFNPHPPLLAGETPMRSSANNCSCFNPHPPLLAGETSVALVHCNVGACVSIHTRHYWRVKRGVGVPGRWKSCFNPHPPLLAGETVVDGARRIARKVSIHTRHYWRVKRRKVGVDVALTNVSIHTRHYWRVKRVMTQAWTRFTRFNPHPPLLAGETQRWRLRHRICRRFNPHPPLLAGETCAKPGATRPPAFQSTPAITGG